MTKRDFVADIIRRTDSYPFTGKISLKSAQLLLNNTFPEHKPEGITAAEVRDLWNELINDPDVMEP